MECSLYGAIPLEDYDRLVARLDSMSMTRKKQKSSINIYQTTLGTKSSSMIRVSSSSETDIKRISSETSADISQKSETSLCRRREAVVAEGDIDIFLLALGRNLNHSFTINSCRFRGFQDNGRNLAVELLQTERDSTCWIVKVMATVNDPDDLALAEAEVLKFAAYLEEYTYMLFRSYSSFPSICKVYKLPLKTFNF